MAAPSTMTACHMCQQWQQRQTGNAMENRTGFSGIFWHLPKKGQAEKKRRRHLPTREKNKKKEWERFSGNLRRIQDKSSISKNTQLYQYSTKKRKENSFGILERRRFQTYKIFIQFYDGNVQRTEGQKFPENKARSHAHYSLSSQSNVTVYFILFVPPKVIFQIQNIIQILFLAKFFFFTVSFPPNSCHTISVSMLLTLFRSTPIHLQINQFDMNSIFKLFF